MCRQGASAIQSSVLEQIDDPSLRAFVAWVPILPKDGEAAARTSTALVPDARAAHFWNAENTLARLFARTLDLPEGRPAWDVYLAYPPGPTWDDAPPAPSFWHHQLGELDIAPRLDGPAFAAGVRKLLAGS
jgi:hypothetical protein